MKLFPNVTRHRLVTHTTHHHLTYLTNTQPIILLIFGAALNAILASFSRDTHQTLPLQQLIINAIHHLAVLVLSSPLVQPLHA